VKPHGQNAYKNFSRPVSHFLLIPSTSSSPAIYLPTILTINTAQGGYPLPYTCPARNRSHLPAQPGHRQFPAQAGTLPSIPSGMCPGLLWFRPLVYLALERSPTYHIYTNHRGTPLPLTCSARTRIRYLLSQDTNHFPAQSGTGAIFPLSYLY